MGLRDLVRTVLGDRSRAAEEEPEGFQITTADDGIDLVIGREALRRLERRAEPNLATAQLIALRMLTESGAAGETGSGFLIPTRFAARLDEAFRELFALPDRWCGSFEARVEGTTSQSRFGVTLLARTDDGSLAPVRRYGAILTIGSAAHLVSAEQLDALIAIEAHEALAAEARTPEANVRLVADLQHARSEGLDIDLAYFDRGGFETVTPETIGIRARPDADGGLTLSPTVPGIDPDDLEPRWGQTAERSQGVVRVGTKLILLEERQMAAAHEILKNRRIAPESVPLFMKAPSAFLDGALVNLDLGFSVRVEGIGRIEHVDFGIEAEGGLDWFAKEQAVSPASLLVSMIRTTEDLDEAERLIAAARADGADAIRFDEVLVDIGSPEAVARALSEARQRIAEQPDGIASPPGATPTATGKEQVGFLIREAGNAAGPLRDLAERALVPREPAYDRLRRRPFPHQREGIEWMVGLMCAARRGDRTEMHRLQGALLADDMGLGKTFMTLVAAAELRRDVEESGERIKPMLIVAPLSLIENWEDEIRKTFSDPPFEEVVVLQSSRDLPRFRMRGRGRETLQESAALDEDGKVDAALLRTSLRVGPEYGSSRLDAPGRLVLTTYETLRDYQISLSQVDWGLAVFDEAQAIKTSTTSRARAAKALRADFRLLMTGTPVENSLAEFWCLVDTAQPGLLGSWSDFRETFVVPIRDATGEEERLAIGRQLRRAVGRFMLRRDKEDHLEGLPRKTVFSGAAPVHVAEDRIHDPALGPLMPHAQRAEYDARIAAMRENGATALATLQRLRLASLHPLLDIGERHAARPSSLRESSEQVAMSAKAIAAMTVLHRVRERGEKAIVFILSREAQLLFALWCSFEFGIRPHVINGDTAATSNSDGTSRRQLIESFEQSEGFDVIIMSPIAAGVGLTVVGANHVVHLERHWNPAKEAQATDRAYRIGQTRDVSVYLPASIHPHFDSFDVLLGRLLESKNRVKDAVMTQGAVQESDMMNAVSRAVRGPT
ncbi:DEAD/DEAH box helicase [Microbacterium sp. gxy059]|uniref:DEAD/DEAH box helicase n=1 Tax=Microbacterium sp. gxy059 TaxID=2957199 RepID=UPI003D96B5BE